MLILVMLCCWVGPVSAEVKRSNGKIVMEESDYRFFISRIVALEAETTALKNVLAEERASFDVYVLNVRKEREAHSGRSAAYERRIDELAEDIRSLRRQKILPGILVGGGMNTKGNLEGFVGVGWKIF